MAPDRLLELGVIPMINLQDALAELEHIRKLGLKGAMLGIFPTIPAEVAQQNE